MVTDPQVMEALARVRDPEIPAVSVIDLGIVEEVRIEDDRVEVTCLPTFVGCPALDAIRQDIERALVEIGAEPSVRFIYRPPWTSDRITEEGRRRLNEYGLAPPAPGDIEDSESHASVRVALLTPGACPYCGSRDTIMESPFGPTLCRATCYCRSCRNPFEKFKRV